MCVRLKHGILFCHIELFCIEEMCRLYRKAMAAANFSRDVLEMFYGSIEENKGLPTQKGKQRPVQIFSKNEKFIHKRLHE